MKKLTALLLAVLMVVGLTACGGAKEDINTKSEGVMTHAEYTAAELGAEVTIEAYVQATQSWWDNKIVAYLQDGEGAYFAYNMACTEADAAKLTPGTKIRVKGFKDAYAGEVEIIDGTFEILEGNYVAEAADLTSLLGTDDMIKHQNEFATFKGLTVAASKDADGNEVPFLYKWNGSGAEGDDVYFNVSYNGKTFTFLIESYLCGKDTDVYKAAQNLKVGDTIDVEGFVYWYDAINPHITKITVK